jgi:polyvinyl alcohol dehydrogenase (cytochrome)
VSLRISRFSLKPPQRRRRASTRPYVSLSWKRFSCGDREPCLPAQTAAVTLIPGVVFSGSRDGFLRAYSSISGRILWEFGTAREFETVNGVKGKGGTLDVSGAAVVDGIVLTTSGYSQFGGIAGNVLLAFSDGGT